MLVWCDLHVARNVLCMAISRAVVTNTRDFTKTLGMSHKIHACTALASVKFKSSCTVCMYVVRIHYIYIYTYTYVRTYICTYISTYIQHTYIHTYIKTHDSESQGQDKADHM